MEPGAAWRSDRATARAAPRAGSLPVGSTSRGPSRRSNSSAEEVWASGAGGAAQVAAGQLLDGQACGELEFHHGPLAVAGEVRGVGQGVAEQQAQHHHLPLRVAQPRHRRHGAGGRPRGPGRPSSLGDRVAGHGDQPGACLDLVSGGRRQPRQGGVEDLSGQGRRFRGVAGPGQEVAVDGLDLVVVEEGERLPVAGGGAFEQGALARHLGRHVAVPARAGVRRAIGSECHRGPSAAEQELQCGREHDHDEQGGHDNGGPGSHAAADSTCSAGLRERVGGWRPWPAGCGRSRGSRGAPRAGPGGRRPRCARRARG
jgi:hypothetical protein